MNQLFQKRGLKMRKTSLVLAELDPVVLGKLQQIYEVQVAGRTHEEAISHIKEIDPEVVVIEAQPFKEDLLQHAKSLKLIASVRGTPSNVDLDYCNRHGISVTSSPGRNAVAVAEYTIASILNIARHIPQAYMALRVGRMVLTEGEKPRDDVRDVIWVHSSLKERPYVKFRGIELEERTLGIIGFGSIGQLVARKARGLDMRVLAADPYAQNTLAKDLGVEVTSLEELLHVSDFVSLHSKVTPETEKMLGKTQFALMKNTAFLINTARGALINQADLLDALRQKTIAGAVLDVFESEPLPVNHPFLHMENVIALPHIGGATEDVVKHHSRCVFENLISYARGEALPNLTNHPQKPQ
jgi:D-3-phosphoglycerate dehydrogenase